MTGRLQGKTALVTAAGQGIGRAIAEGFLREGARVIATDLDEGKLAGLDGATVRRLDVLSNDAVDALAREIGPVHVIANCAGYVAHGTVLECDERSWDFSFDLNVKSMHRVIKAFLPGMLENGGGSIVNIASGASSLKGAPNRYVYGNTKAVAIDFIAKGIRCNAICPGTIQSPSLDDRIGALATTMSKSEQEARAMFISRQPMGRLGTPEEVAHLAVYLASDESAFTTGTTAVIDGGWTL